MIFFAIIIKTKSNYGILILNYFFYDDYKPVYFYSLFLIITITK